jgi:hypothetical protein
MQVGLLDIKGGNDGTSDKNYNKLGNTCYFSRYSCFYEKDDK